MSLACKISASFLLICFFSPRGAEADTVWGALGRDFYLNISFQASDTVDNIRWQINGEHPQFKKNSKQPQTERRYKVFENGTLEIKSLQRNDSGQCKVTIYDGKGKNLFEKTYELKVEEVVSKPVLTLDCKNRKLTCQLPQGTKGTHRTLVLLRLYKSRKLIQNFTETNITHKWLDNQSSVFNCTASNHVSWEAETRNTSECAGKGLDIYLIAGICGGGTIFLIFVVLLIVYISNRRKQNSRRDEEEERGAPRGITKEGGQKPHQMPGSASPNPALLQPPPPPAHRCQSPGLRPPPPGHRGQHQQQKRPLPSPGPQAPQQKGPPLPRPRVCPKPPQGAAEKA